MEDVQALKFQFLDMMTTMKKEGLVDHFLENVHTMKDVNSPYFFIRTISSFISDSQIALREMFNTTAQTEVDYSVLEGLCFKVKGSSSNVGAHRMAKSCNELRDAIENKSKKDCVAAIESIKEEFVAVHAKMDALVQVEKQIVNREKA